MTPFWVQFRDRPDGCIEAKDMLTAREEADKLGAVAAINVLPYPRTPRIGQNKSDCPAFCFGDIKECLGRTACPRRRACDD